MFTIEISNIQLRRTQDMGLEYDMYSIIEVEPKQVTTIKYIKKEYE